VLVRLSEVLALERAIHRLFALRSAADAADIAVDARTSAPGLADPAYNAIHAPSIESEWVDHREWMRTNLFIKVVVEHEPKESPEKLGAELCRQLERNYIVRDAELSSFAPVED
jgi:hypothetical protein